MDYIYSAIDQELMYLDMMLDTDEIDLAIPANFEMNVDTNSRFCKFLHMVPLSASTDNIPFW